MASLGLPAGMPRRSRRASVSAEADGGMHMYRRVVIPKSDEAMQRIEKAISTSFLFKGLEREQVDELVGAMREMEVEAGFDVIKQGAMGDYFYVVDSGVYEVFKMDNDEPVWTYDNSGSFGELALMYNCPRSATVRVKADGVLWALDRSTFRHIIVDYTRKKRQMFEGFLAKVSAFKNLSPGERSKIADCLESRTYADGERIIKQGDVGDQFFIVESGTCVALQTPAGASEPVEVGRMSAGHYFGERALIKLEPRACDVVAQGETKVAAMERSAFDRLLGNLQDIMGRQIEEYKTAEEILSPQKTKN